MALLKKRILEAEIDASSVTGKEDVANKDTDGTLAANSDVKYASQKAVKTYADTKMADLIDDTTPQLGGDLDLNGKNIDFPTTGNISDCLDEDDMASNSAVMLATQQSIKAYVDNVLTNIVCNDGEVVTNNGEVVIL